MNCVWKTTGVMIGLLAASAVASAQGFRPGGSLVVRDSQGRLVGQLVGTGAVSIVVNNKVVVLSEVRQRLSDFGAGLWFDQPGCQGNGFILLSTVSMYLSTPAAFDPAGVLHIADFNSPVQSVNLLSRYHDNSQTCSSESLLATDALPATATVNIKALFTPPFSLGEGSGGAVSVPGVGPLALVVLATALATAGAVRLVR